MGAAGKLRYGAGLMDLSYPMGSGNISRIRVQGHEGDTYGFVSSQGYVPSLKGGYSVVVNVDQENPMRSAVCYLLQTLNAVIGGSSAQLGCRLRGSDAEIIV